MSASPKNAQDFGQNSHNKLGYFTFSLSMLVSFAVLIYVSFLSGGIDLKEVPELKTGEKVPGTSAPTNPDAPAAAPAPAPGAAPAAPAEPHGASNSPDYVPSEASIQHGAELFAQNCVSCHGPKGEGDGPAGANLSPRPRNLVEGQWKFGGTRLGIMNVLSNGSPGTAMQSYRYLALNDRWSLVHFVRSITKNKISDSDSDIAAQAASLN